MPSTPSRRQPAGCHPGRRILHGSPEVVGLRTRGVLTHFSGRRTPNIEPISTPPSSVPGLPRARPTRPSPATTAHLAEGTGAGAGRGLARLAAQDRPANASNRQLPERGASARPWLASPRPGYKAGRPSRYAAAVPRAKHPRGCPHLPPAVRPAPERESDGPRCAQRLQTAALHHILGRTARDACRRKWRGAEQCMANIAPPSPTTGSRPKPRRCAHPQRSLGRRANGCS